MIKESIIGAISLLTVAGGAGWGTSEYIDNNLVKKKELVLTQNMLSNSLFDYRTSQLRLERKQINRRIKTEREPEYYQFQIERVQEIEEELEDLKQLRDNK